jgi:hypothetical protein
MSDFQDHYGQCCNFTSFSKLDHFVNAESVLLKEQYPQFQRLVVLFHTHIIYADFVVFVKGVRVCNNLIVTGWKILCSFQKFTY